MNAVVSFPDADTMLSPTMLAAALEACPESLAIVENTCVVYANSAFARLFGFADSSELRQRALADFLPEGRLCTQPGSEHIAACDSTACGYPGCRFEGKRRDGSHLAMEASCARVRSQGRTLLMMAVRDVSQPERRRLVRESERRFRTIFDASAIGISHCTLDGCIVESNQALEKLLDYSHEELRGMPFRDFLQPAEWAAVEELFQEVVTGKRDSYQLELRYARKDRRPSWARTTFSLVRGPDSRPEFAIVMMEDVTERKHAEQQLREAQKMEAIGRLVGGVAHDFNNLLTGIMLYCDLLMGGLESGGRLHHHAEEIRLASEHGAALIQQLLAVARQQVVEPRVLCLNEVVSAMRNLLSRLIGENIKLVTKLDAALGSVRIDPTQAQQIILNLVLNARDAMPEGGTVTLETRNGEALDRCSNAPSDSPGPGIVLAVADTGCGMDAATRARLFEPFFTTKQPGKGNGLGLATVQGAVKQCGGTVEVESEPGQGTCIRILLPAVENELPSPPHPDSAQSSVAQGTILIVEDDVVVRQSAQRILDERGYEVLQAANGTEALNICRSYKGDIHLLLVDMVMPGMSGPQVAQQALAIRPAMRVLYASGYSPAATDALSGTEPLALFRKPFTGSALFRKVREVLNQSELQRLEGKTR